MELNKTISVEPGKVTLAEKNHKKITADFLRMSVLDRSESKDLDLTELLFPGKSITYKALQQFYLPLKSVFSAILIILGINMLTVPQVSGGFFTFISIFEIISGVMLGIGLLTRPVMALNSIFMLASGIISLRHGIVDISTFSYMFGSLMFVVLGSGKYSCDYYIRKIFKSLKLKRERMKGKNYMSYRAFDYATKNL